MTRSYIVRTEKFGDIEKRDDTIAEARRWARSAFGPAATVHALRRSKPCIGCGSSPCSASCWRSKGDR